MNPKVTAIVLSYNNEHFIGQALEAVFSQDYENYEIIIRDDASTDRSPEIISNFINSHKPLVDKTSIAFIEDKKNLGLIESYNYVLQMSKGEIIVGFAGDDISYPTRIKETVNLLLKYNVDLVSSDAQLINTEGKIIANSVLGLSDNYEQIGNGFFEDNYRIIKGLLKDNILINLGGYGFTYRREILPFPGIIPKKATAEDHFISFLAIINRGALIYNKPLLDYRIHDRSYTTSSSVNNPYELVNKYLQRKESNAIVILDYVEEKSSILKHDQFNLFKTLNIEIFNARFLINYCKKDYTSNVFLILNSLKNPYISVAKFFISIFLMIFPYYSEKKIKNIYKSILKQKGNLDIKTSLTN